MRVVSGKQVSEDVPIDLGLRPKRLGEFVGQQEVKQNLNIAIAAAQKKRRIFRPCFVLWPSWIGKNHPGTYYRC